MEEEPPLNASNQPRRRKDLNNPTTKQIEQQLGRNAAEVLNEQLINLEDSYKAALQWIALQKQKEPIVQRLVQQYQQFAAILQDPGLLAAYHDRYFQEVTEDPRRNIALYRHILTDTEEFKRYIHYFFTQVAPDELAALQQLSPQAGSIPPQNGQLTWDWSQSFFNKGLQLTDKNIADLKNALMGEYRVGNINDATFYTRMNELETFNDPARLSMKQTQVQTPPVQPGQPGMQQQVPQQQFQPQVVQRPAFPSMPAQAASQDPGASMNVSRLPLWQQQMALEGAIANGQFQLAA